MKLSQLYETVTDRDVGRLLKVINSTGVDYTLIGGHSLNNYIPRRPSKDVDIVSNNWKPIVAAVQKAFPGLEIEETPHSIRIRRDGEDFLDIIKPKGGNALYRNTVGDTNIVQFDYQGQQTKVPKLEQLIAVKFAAMVSPFRGKEAVKDAVDFIELVKAHPDADLKILKKLGDEVYRGGGQEIIAKFKAALDHPDPPFSI